MEGLHGKDEKMQSNFEIRARENYGNGEQKQTNEFWPFFPLKNHF